MSGGSGRESICSTVSTGPYLSKWVTYRRVYRRQLASSAYLTVIVHLQDNMSLNRSINLAGTYLPRANLHRQDPFCLTVYYIGFLVGSVRMLFGDVFSIPSDIVCYPVKPEPAASTSNSSGWRWMIEVGEVLVGERQFRLALSHTFNIPVDSSASLS